FGDLGVVLDLRRGRDHPVHPALDQGPYHIRAVLAARRQVSDNHGVAGPAGGLLRGHRDLGDGQVGSVGGDQAQGAGESLDQVAGDGVRLVAEFLGDLDDPGRGLGGNPYRAAVEDLARGLEADTGTRGDLLDGDVPSRHEYLPVGRERTFALINVVSVHIT